MTDDDLRVLRFTFSAFHRVMALVREYERLRKEVAQLRAELATMRAGTPA